jgi:hypothetical protein
VGGISLLRRLNARQHEVVMKGVNENRYLLHAVLSEIQELSPVTSAESVMAAST